MSRTSVPLSRHVDDVNDAGDADEKRSMHICAEIRGGDADGHGGGQKQNSLR